MSIKQLLPASRVVINVTVDNWEDAVRAAGQLLVDTGAVKESYIEGMINTTKELGPYIVIAPGFAIPHSRPEDGVLEPCYAIVKLDPPVAFGNPENDPVHVLLAFGATDHDSHIKSLTRIATILSDEKNLKALTSATTKEQILEIIWRDEDD